jgi:endo-1,4-beta-D-glucanase Y
LFTIAALFTEVAMAMAWTITIEGRNEFGEVCRRQIQIDKSWERLRDGEIGLSIDDGKTIMKTLQRAVVTQEMETYALFLRVCPDCHTFRPVKDYTMRRFERCSAPSKSGTHDGCCARTATRGWWVGSPC